MATDWALGTPLFFPPIRFWENKEPETGSVAAHVDFHGEALSNPTHDGFVYAFHDGYRHNVYMRRADCFMSRADAVAEIERRTAEHKAQEAADFEVIWQRIKKHLSRRAQTPNESVHHGY